MFQYPEVPGKNNGLPDNSCAGQPGRGAHPEGDARHDCVLNIFYGTVDARGSTFGKHFGAPAGPDGRLRITTGTIRDAEVHATVSNYVRPSTFDDAVAWLRRNRVVVLAGDPGSGRRAGAIALLREVVDDRMLVTLSPAVTAEELAEWEYREDHGYLVVDSESLGDGEEDDPAWASIAERVRKAGTYLVVTTKTVPDRIASTVVPYLIWERPPIAEVLRGHLDANWPKDEVDGLVDMLLGRLPANYSLRWLACLARRVNARRDPVRALQEMDEMCGRQVRQWFDQPRTRQELSEVTAAAFLAGAGERTFWSRLARLEQLLIEYEPLHERKSGLARQYGDPPTASHGLLRVAQAPSAAGTSRVVVFKEHSYQRFVAGRIRTLVGSWFWNAVKVWINELVDGAERLEVASGLAWLACTELDEVEASFLEPWSRGRLGWSGRVGATYVLWCMCRDEVTAPMALRTAIRWASSGDADQRATAVMAFSGELGVSYPADASRRLWQLMTQSDDLCETSRIALGRLFAVLVDQTREAGVVLTLLDAQRARFCVPEGKHRMRSLAIDAVLAVVTARSNRTGRPAVAELLRAEPHRRDLIARLWGSALHHGPTRRESLIALWHSLQAFQDMGHEIVPDAYEFGVAIAEILSGIERARLSTELAQLDEELRHGRATPTAEALVAFLAALV